MEYASTIWNPQQKTQIKQIEQIQRNSARWVLNKPYNHINPSSADELIDKLQWPLLRQRRVWTDCILMYKIVHGLVAIPVAFHPQLANIRSTRGSHSFKFIPIRAKLDIYKYSFIPRTIQFWNQLPESCVSATSLDAFKANVQLGPTAF